MKESKLLVLVILLLILWSGCSKKLHRYITENPPAPLLFPDDIDLSLVGPPPLLISENKLLTKSKISSQYFKIAIPPCVDMTNTSENLKNSLADIFYTALFETKRFNLMDRLEIKKIEEIDLEEIKTFELSKLTHKQDSLAIESIKSEEIAENITEHQLELHRQSEIKKQIIIERLKARTDGILQLYITSNNKSLDGREGSVGIDYRIVSTKYEYEIVLFAGSQDIRYRYNEITGSLTFTRSDINEVANTIKNKFPNPTFDRSFVVIDKKDMTITINAGKEDNIIEGMVGFVVKAEQISGIERISYRAEFVITEVFNESCNALLLINLQTQEEDSIIVRTISLNEPIKMK